MDHKKQKCYISKFQHLNISLHTVYLFFVNNLLLFIVSSRKNLDFLSRLTDILSPPPSFISYDPRRERIQVIVVSHPGNLIKGENVFRKNNVSRKITGYLEKIKHGLFVFLFFYVHPLSRNIVSF